FCDPMEYPLGKTRISFDRLREVAHLRPRTNAFGAVARVRNTLAMATHQFFQDRGFFYFNAPLITASDCEGAGQMFQVTTLDLENPPRDKETGKVDYSQDFFGRKANLTVSGQLEAETHACALGSVYTFGPTFRAENSNTTRHLSEFWMIEPEIAFADLHDDADLAEDFLRALLLAVTEKCVPELNFFDLRVEKGIRADLERLSQAAFTRITYTEAIEILKKHSDKFEFKPEWGIDLQSEHERFLTEQIFNGPVTVMNYPKEIKAFYMRLNDDGKTVAAMDVLLPKVGEIIGGSQREERLDVLQARIKELGMDEAPYWWYLDLRRFGSVPHAGFGLGFERMVRFCTGMGNIRDVIPFPRAPMSAEF
ncbi:MAG: asparagine--tRNA ligase, partial [Victivallales bacterium]|nr:asparagine--tRNA ligase [Victivallales bacterium]